MNGSERAFLLVAEMVVVWLWPLDWMVILLNDLLNTKLSTLSLLGNDLKNGTRVISDNRRRTRTRLQVWRQKKISMEDFAFSFGSDGQAGFLRQAIFLFSFSLFDASKKLPPTADATSAALVKQQHETDTVTVEINPLMEYIISFVVCSFAAALHFPTSIDKIFGALTGCNSHQKATGSS